MFWRTNGSALLENNWRLLLAVQEARVADDSAITKFHSKAPLYRNEFFVTYVENRGTTTLLFPLSLHVLSCFTTKSNLVRAYYR